MQKESQWQCIGLRIVFSEKGPDPIKHSWLTACDGRFLLVHWNYDRREILQLIHQATRDSQIQLQGPECERCSILLPSEGPTDVKRQLSWSTSQMLANQFEDLPGHAKRVAFVLQSGGAQVSHWFDAAAAQDLNAWLLNPPYDLPPTDGLNGWLRRYAPGMKILPGTNDNAQFRVLAPIPVNAEYKRDCNQVLLHCPPDGIELVSASAFYPPGHQPAKLRFNATDAAVGDLPSFAAGLEWPATAETAEVVVLAQTTVVNRIFIPRWAHAGNLSAAVASYFDKDHKILRSQLLEESLDQSRADKIQDQFEGGTQRLLSLLGLPCVFYGEKGASVQSRPDAVIIEQSPTQGTVILVECTTGRKGEKISEKIKGLEERIGSLTSHIQNGHHYSVTIHGTVFSRKEPLNTDFQLASRCGVGLLGPSEIESLFERLKGPRTPPAEILSLLIQPPIASLYGGDQFAGLGYI